MMKPKRQEPFRKEKRHIPLDAPVSKTRVCIKNLPPTFTESDLRSFLVEQLQATVTDCRVLKDSLGKSRRMAFCGFLKSSQAQQCVERLHKSYCRSARLMVEYATLPVVRNNTKEPEDVEVKAEAELKETKQTEQEAAVERKKQEFLAVMGVGNVQTKRKFWANDDDDQGKAEEAPAPEEAVEEKADPINSDSSSDDSDSDDDADPLQARQSDMDFLRSKKVAADDLDEAPESEEPKKATEPKDDSSASSSDSERDAGLQHQSNEKKVAQEESQTNDGDHDMDSQEQEVKVSNRLFLRNLPFSATEDDIREHFGEIGTIVECHVPADDQKRSKGFGFITYANTSNAKTALETVDGTDFQGRILHILPAREAPVKHVETDEHGDSYKGQMERKRKENALSETAGWSASFVRGDAVVDNLASRLGLRKGDIMAVKDGLSAGDAAVRLALGETAVIEENRKYFATHGFDMDVLVSASPQKGKDDSVPRSKTAILVKNLPHDTAKDELLKMFGSTGEGPKSILLPPSRTIAVVEYSHGNDAKSAFRRLAYRRFKSVPLYLEWAPLAAKVEGDKVETETDKHAEEAEPEDNDAQETLVSSGTPTLYIKNLNFKTTESQLQKVFSEFVKDIRSVRIPRKAAPIKRGVAAEAAETLSMGFGFVEFGSQESARKALKHFNGKLIDGHALEIKPSERGNVKDQSAKTKSGKNTSKLMIRNVPFQANRKELLQLFGSFGQLKKVRMPKKFDGGNRGFAFVEYLTGKEAAAAMKSLSRTHLYGRHLVIEWAAADEETEGLDTLRERAEKDITIAAPKNKKIKFNY